MGARQYLMELYVFYSTVAVLHIAGARDLREQGAVFPEKGNRQSTDRTKFRPNGKVCTPFNIYLSKRQSSVEVPIAAPNAYLIGVSSLYALLL